MYPPPRVCVDVLHNLDYTVPLLRRHQSILRFGSNKPHYCPALFCAFTAGSITVHYFFYSPVSRLNISIGLTGPHGHLAPVCLGGVRGRATWHPDVEPVVGETWLLFLTFCEVDISTSSLRRPRTLQQVNSHWGEKSTGELFWVQFHFGHFDSDFSVMGSTGMDLLHISISCTDLLYVLFMSAVPVLACE